MAKIEYKPGVYKHENGGELVARNVEQAKVFVRDGFTFIRTAEADKKAKATKEAEVKKPAKDDNK